MGWYQRVQFVCDERTLAKKNFAKPEVADKAKRNGKCHHFYELGHKKRFLVQINKRANGNKKHPKHPAREHNRNGMKTARASHGIESKRNGVIEFGEKHIWLRSEERRVGKEC